MPRYIDDAAFGEAERLQLASSAAQLIELVINYPHIRFIFALAGIQQVQPESLPSYLAWQDLIHRSWLKEYRNQGRSDFVKTTIWIQLKGANKADSFDLDPVIENVQWPEAIQFIVDEVDSIFGAIPADLTDQGSASYCANLILNPHAYPEYDESFLQQSAVSFKVSLHEAVSRCPALPLILSAAANTSIHLTNELPSRLSLFNSGQIPRVIRATCRGWLTIASQFASEIAACDIYTELRGGINPYYLLLFALGSDKALGGIDPHESLQKLHRKYRLEAMQCESVPPPIRVDNSNHSIAWEYPRSLRTTKGTGRVNPATGQTRKPGSHRSE